MLFMQLDHGAILRKETGRETPKMIRFVIGNPLIILIMKEMAKHIPDAGSYAPVTVLIDERADGVHLSYDRMASFLAPYGNRDALEVARNLDKKIEDLYDKLQLEHQDAHPHRPVHSVPKMPVSVILRMTVAR